MAIKFKNLFKPVVKGGTGHSVYVGYKAFTTTGGTVSEQIPLKVVKSISFMWAGTPAADEILSVTNTLNAAGEIRSASPITLAFARTGASKTSGLGFWFTAIGEE